ncbi:MAG: capsular biosynthesis protein [Desulfuromonadales bacterium]|nr:capsular biosynthesis protein [Desulfuromonadales bacterium]
MRYLGRKILLLQGPMGPFFWWLSRALQRRGATVHKINFNFGDLLFYPFKSLLYRKSLLDWPLQFEQILQEYSIQEIVLFGDCRAYHQAAIKVANRLGIRVLVFEEGYLRPHWVTLEEGGVNGNSRLSNSPDFYLNQPPAPQPEPESFPHSFGRMALFSTLYSLAEACGSPLFPNYSHHRGLNPWYEIFVWLRSALRRRRHTVNSKQVKKRCKGALAKNYFLLPLQVRNDSQIRHHSPFQNIDSLLETVLESFAAEAPKELFLVIKHHPMDRGYSDYSKQIKSISRTLGLYDRVIYTWDSHLPTILNNALGVVTANSTVGLQALYHRIPVKVLGKAIYDIPGLTSADELAQFWVNPTPPDSFLYQKFREYLLATNQANTSFAYPPTEALLEHWGGMQRESGRTIVTAEHVERPFSSPA